jgi:mono/diheme cytochrome c family protein
MKYAGAICLAALVAANQVHAQDAAKPSPAASQFFESKVRPLLAENCFQCHGDKKQRGSLRLDSLASILEGGDQGPALVPGHPEKSLLVKAISHADPDFKMPPTKKLSREQIADLTNWIKLGAPWPGGAKAVASAPRKEEKAITAEERAHWAFQPVKRPAPPAVRNHGWSRRPIDQFILARLEAKGLQPNPPAPPQELLRRVYYDLTGLPPPPQEVADFVAKWNAPSGKRQALWEDTIDRLLDSPRYGEKWARHWLDLVRYAETNSYERDNPKPHVWRYRDYVIRAFNGDKPFDQFIREQLAGDELDAANADCLIATGYYRLGIWDDEPSDPVQSRYDGLDDIVATTGQVFLGLTFDCARCHDHKIDPILQKDYYRLVSFFHNINHYRNGGPTDEQPIGTPEQREAFAKAAKKVQDKRAELQAKITAIENEFRRLAKADGTASADLIKLIRTDGPRILGQQKYDQWEQLTFAFNESRAAERMPKIDMALCVTEAGPRAPDTFVMLRGNPHVKGDKVEPAFPTIFNLPQPKLPDPPAGAKSSGRRRMLADWIASPDNVLTARVIVNRLWQHHFGRGIVRSPNDFGMQGMRPTHPELLDWLAAEFVEKGWRMKALHRLILTSNAYQMSSRGNAEALKLDPTNDLFWRFDMRRLTGEEIRDSILAVSGNLDLKMFGPSIYPEIPEEVLQGQSMPGRGWKRKAPAEEQNRRSVYVHVKRSLLLPILESFDLAEPDRSTPVRFSTTQPTQALGMLNGEFLNKQAGIFAQRLQKEAGNDVAGQVRLALSLATQRPPSAEEVQRGVRLIETLQREESLTTEAALRMYCLVVLNLNEFVYVD